MYSDGGEGASPDCISMTLAALKDTVSRYDLPHSVSTTTSKELLGGAWQQHCRLLVMPGGRDLPYCGELDGQGNQYIRDYVLGGGSYLGICAGGYYGSAYVEFDKGDPGMEVVGPRELAFFLVTAQGPVFPGFTYEASTGAYAAGTTITESGSEVLGLPVDTFSLFYNGGCDFAPRDTANSNNCALSSSYEVLAAYTGQSEPRPPSPSPHLSSSSAVVGGGVGRGRVILSGLHFEASMALLAQHYPQDERVNSLLPVLKSSEQQRQLLCDACIRYLLHSI